MNCTLKIRFPGITLDRAAILVPFGMAIDAALVFVDDNQEEFRAEVVVYQDGVFSNSHLRRVNLGMPLKIKLFLVRYRGKRSEVSNAYLYYGKGQASAEVHPLIGERLHIEGGLQKVIEDLVKALIATISLPSAAVEG